ncbi:MAG: TetR/AcrR family transcriptional regulator [Actinobacteria bacterium]|nr:TetR/AcrR family transcriptional regulator [Actinomycetota bacterium]
MEMRERILEGFKKLSRTKGFHGATVDELSSRTGVSKRTIYRYFGSKDELVGAVMDEIMTLTEKKVNQNMASDKKPVEKVMDAIRIVSQNTEIISPVIMRDLQKYYPHMWEKVENFRAQKVQLFIDILVTGNKDGYFREIDPKIFTASLLASIRAVVNPSFILENSLTLEKAMFGLFNIFLYGIVESGKDRL